MMVYKTTFKVTVTMAIFDVESGCATLDPILDWLSTPTAGNPQFAEKTGDGYEFLIQALDAVNAIERVTKLIDEKAHEESWQDEFGINEREAIVYVSHVVPGPVLWYQEASNKETVR